MEELQPVTSGTKDAVAIAPATGEGTGTLKRNIGPVGIVGLGLSIVNGWGESSLLDLP
jgi:hypothetical protein